MNGIGHTYLAAATAATTVAATDSITEPTSLLLAGMILAGSELPDTDLWLPLVKHRGLTHRLWFHIALTAIVYAALATYAPGWETAGSYGLFLGLLVHAVADMMTPEGLRYLAPFYNKPIRIMPFRWRVVPEGPPRQRRSGATTRSYEPWHRPYVWNGYVAVSQEWALAAITVLYALLIYLTLPVTL